MGLWEGSWRGRGRDRVTALRSFLSSHLEWGLGRLRLPVATWDQEVTLRMEVTCQEREAGRQRKSEGVPHDWELPISLENALGTPLIQEREELPLCSNHGQFGFSVTWRYQICKNYIRCCLFWAEGGLNLRVTVFFFLMIWVLIFISVILAVMLKTLNKHIWTFVFKKNPFRFYSSEYGLLSHINIPHEPMK